MSLFVIDASVAAKWFLPPRGETLVPEALSLLTRYAEGQLRFLVPDLSVNKMSRDEPARNPVKR